MKAVRLSAVPLVVLSVVLMGAAITLADVSYSQIAFIPIPLAGTPLTNPLRSFDISWVDRSTKTYFLADRSNASVDVFNARDNSFVTAFGGFVGVSSKGNDFSGPNGVLVAHPEHEVWAGDGDSTVKVFDLKTGKMLPPISTGGKARADELAFDQEDHVVLVANDADDPHSSASSMSKPTRWGPRSHSTHSRSMDRRSRRPMGSSSRHSTR